MSDEPRSVVATVVHIEDGVVTAVGEKRVSDPAVVAKVDALAAELEPDVCTFYCCDPDRPESKEQR